MLPSKLPLDNQFLEPLIYLSGSSLHLIVLVAALQLPAMVSCSVKSRLTFVTCKSVLTTDRRFAQLTASALQHLTSSIHPPQAGPYALLGARKNKKQLFVFADAIFRKDRKQNKKKCRNKRGRRKSSRRIRRHIMCRVIFRDKNMSDTIETLAYACSTCLPPYPVFSALSRTHKMCLKSFCSRHAAFCIGGPKYKKQACVLYRLGYEQKQVAFLLFAGP